MKTMYQINNTKLNIDVEPIGLLVNEEGFAPKKLHASISENGKENKLMLDVEKGQDGRYYATYDNTPVYLDEFIPKYSYDELIAVINGGETRVTNEELVQTFIKYRDEVCMTMDVLAADTLMPTLGVSLSSNNYIKTVVKPVESNQYTVSRWLYKIEFAPIFDEIEPYLPTRAHYTMDLVSTIRQGHIQLLKKDLILPQMQEIAELYKVACKTRKLFKKSEELEKYCAFNVNIPFITEKKHFALRTTTFIQSSGVFFPIRESY